MNLPNKLTLLRILLVPLFVAAMLIPFPLHNLAALLVFAIASITDMFDGRIARERNLVTDFGKFADPLADKILVLAAMLCFVQNGLCDCVAVIIVLLREFAVTSIRLIAAAKGEVVAANIWGKGSREHLGQGQDRHPNDSDNRDPRNAVGARCYDIFKRGYSQVFARRLLLRGRGPDLDIDDFRRNLRRDILKAKLEVY